MDLRFKWQKRIGHDSWYLGEASCQRSGARTGIRISTGAAHSSDTGGFEERCCDGDLDPR